MNSSSALLSRAEQDSSSMALERDLAASQGDIQSVIVSMAVPGVPI